MRHKLQQNFPPRLLHYSIMVLGYLHYFHQESSRGCNRVCRLSPPLVYVSCSFYDLELRYSGWPIIPLQLLLDLLVFFRLCIPSRLRICPQISLLSSGLEVIRLGVGHCRANAPSLVEKMEHCSIDRNDRRSMGSFRMEHGSIRNGALSKELFL